MRKTRAVFFLPCRPTSFVSSACFLTGCRPSGRKERVCVNVAAFPQCCCLSHVYAGPLSVSSRPDSRVVIFVSRREEEEGENKKEDKNGRGQEGQRLEM